MAKDAIENEDQHRSRLNREIDSMLEPQPLLGSGNKHVKTFEASMIVSMAKEDGALNEDIARLIGVSLATLTRHYADELADGSVYFDKYLGRGMKTCAVRAIKGDARYNNVLLRVAACRIGMSEKVQQDNISSDGSMGAGQILNGLPVGSRLVLETPPAETEPAKPAVATKADKKAAKTPKSAKTPPKPPK
ncbi:MAG: hypothetical protein K0U66_07420 [Gammaproteobacteria bacterium]|nr:hypothetical protein [Gammaproteobacteria bacterium]